MKHRGAAMDDATSASAPARYRAFISYSHRDAAFGRRLHRQLETYALPRRLVGRGTLQGPIPRRIAPIFRDRDELSAAHDLTTEVRAALAASGALIVVCSPAAAASRWVGREVELFRSLHPDRPILAALAAGEPHTAFPPALTAAGLTEPLAADFRRQGDGRRIALLKLVAALVGVGLDELVQRDSQRRLARVTAVTAGAVCAMLVMAVLTIVALASRAEAQRQRGQAEALVEFMLTDLRGRLKGVGRLDVMGAVNQRALGYYSGQHLAGLPVDSLERRARLLHAMGEDDMARKDLGAATQKFTEADRTTTTLLAAAPGDPDRIWAQGQSDFWLGFVDYQQGHRAAAGRAWNDYLRRADQLVSIQPDNPKYLREAAYAEGNLCNVALMKPAEPKAAVQACRKGLALMERAAAKLPNDWSAAADLANRHAGLAESCNANQDADCAQEHWIAAEAILKQLIDADPKNRLVRERWIGMQRSLAAVDYRHGRAEAARARIRRALAYIDDMIDFDPSNQGWNEQRKRLVSDLSIIQSK